MLASNKIYQVHQKKWTTF